jgi:hypothetical protein
MLAAITCCPPESTGEKVAELPVTEKDEVESMPSMRIVRVFRSSAAPPPEYVSVIVGVVEAVAPSDGVTAIAELDDELIAKVTAAVVPPGVVTVTLKEPVAAPDAITNVAVI